MHCNRDLYENISLRIIQFESSKVDLRNVPALSYVWISAFDRHRIVARCHFAKYRTNGTKNDVSLVCEAICLAAKSIEVDAKSQVMWKLYKHYVKGGLWSALCVHSIGSTRTQATRVRVQSGQRLKCDRKYMYTAISKYFSKYTNIIEQNLVLGLLTFRIRICPFQTLSAMRSANAWTTLQKQLTIQENIQKRKSVEMCTKMAGNTALCCKWLTI